MVDLRDFVFFFLLAVCGMLLRRNTSPRPGHMFLPGRLYQVERRGWVGCGLTALWYVWWMLLLLAEQREGYVESVLER